MNKLNVAKHFIYHRYLLKFTTREQLERYQQKRLKRHLEFLNAHSPFFKKMDQEIPRMNKQFMMEHFDELNTVGVRKEACFRLALKAEENRDFTQSLNGISVGLSSGTSGHRGIFLTSAREQEKWAGTILAKMLPRKDVFGHRVAFFLRADNNLYHSVSSKLLSFEFFDMFQPIDAHVERLNVFLPTIVIAPASVLRLLAQQKEAGALNIYPRKVVSVAEILEKNDANYILEQFNLAKVDQIYQATEGFLGCTCEHGNLHLNEELIYFEKQWIDEQRFYPIIWDFERTSQPMMNYELNDILVQSTQLCACGSVCTVLEAIEGRSDDIFTFKHRDTREDVLVFPDFIRRVCLFVEGIGQYQVTQKSNGALEIAVECDDADKREQLLTDFELLAEKQQFILPTITFVPYQVDTQVKLKRIRREKEV